MVTQTFNSSTMEADAGIFLCIWSQSRLYTDFQANKDYLKRLYLEKKSILSLKYQENVIPTMNRAKTITQLCERKEKQANQYKTPEAIVHTLQKTKMHNWNIELSFKRK